MSRKKSRIIRSDLFLVLFHYVILVISSEYFVIEQKLFQLYSFLLYISTFYSRFIRNFCVIVYCIFLLLLLCFDFNRYIIVIFIRNLKQIFRAWKSSMFIWTLTMWPQKKKACASPETLLLIFNDPHYRGALKSFVIFQWC